MHHPAGFIRCCIYAVHPFRDGNEEHQIDYVTLDFDVADIVDNGEFSRYIVDLCTPRVVAI